MSADLSPHARLAEWRTQHPETRRLGIRDDGSLPPGWFPVIQFPIDHRIWLLSIDGQWAHGWVRSPGSGSLAAAPSNGNAPIDQIDAHMDPVLSVALAYLTHTGRDHDHDTLRRRLTATAAGWLRARLPDLPEQVEVHGKFVSRADIEAALFLNQITDGADLLVGDYITPTVVGVGEGWVIPDRGARLLPHHRAGDQSGLS